jgi:hypothetical protein
MSATQIKFASAIEPIVRKTAAKPNRAAIIPPSSGPANIPRKVALEVIP